VSCRFHQASDGQPQHQLDPGCARALWESGLHRHHGGRAGIGSRTRPVSFPTGLDVIVEALEELQLNAPKAPTPGRDQHLDFDFRRLEHQLTIYLGPHPS
jgi:hypothetical protein